MSKLRMSKRIVSVLLALCLLLLAVPTANLLADVKGCLSMTVDKTEASIGDTVTATINMSACTTASVTGGLSFDTSKLEVKSIVGSDPAKPTKLYVYPDDEKSVCNSLPTVEESNRTGTVGFGYPGASDLPFTATTVLTATFEVKAYGTLNITLYEDTGSVSSGLTYKSDAADAKSVVVSAGALSGKPTVTGTAKYGETLTADVSALSDKVNIAYQWYRGTTAISGATSSTYSLTANDIGNTVKVRVSATSASDYSGYVESDATGTVGKADAASSVPGGATVTVNNATTETTLTINGLGGTYEYSINNGTTWQTGLTFSGLTVNTAYDVYARVPADTTHEASASVKVGNSLKTKNHVAGNDWYVKETDDGYHYHKCTNGTCGNIIMESTKEAHSYTEKKESKYLKSEATCNAYAVYYKACSVCGAASTSQTWTDTAGGYNTAKHGNYVEAVGSGHLVTAATCHTYAVYYKSCENCHTNHATDTFEYVAGGYDASNHNGTFQELKTSLKTAATCTTYAQYYHICSGCSQPLSTSWTDVAGGYDATNHSGTATQLKTSLKEAATCSSYAEYYEICSACSQPMSSTWTDTASGYNSANHVGFEEAVGGEHLLTVANCHAYAVYYKSCTGCHANHATDTFEDVAGGYNADNHDGTFGETKENLKSAATCTDYAVYYKSCSGCHAAHATDTWTDVAGGKDADNHAGPFTVTGAKLPTYEEVGYTGDVTCEGCSSLSKKGEVLPKLVKDDAKNDMEVNGITEEILKENAKLTDKEALDIQQGAKLKIVPQIKALKTEDVDNAVKSAFDTALANSALFKNKKSSNVSFIDVSILKQIGEGEVTYLTELNKPIPVTVKLSGALLNTDPTVKRTYAVFREHDGVVTMLETSFDEKTTTLSFMNDKFSAYGVVYVDQPIEQPQAEEENNGNNNAKAPDLGDSNIVWLWMLLALASFSALVVLKKKTVR